MEYPPESVVEIIVLADQIGVRVAAPVLDPAERAVRVVAELGVDAVGEPFFSEAATGVPGQRDVIPVGGVNPAQPPQRIILVVDDLAVAQGQPVQPPAIAPAIGEGFAPSVVMNNQFGFDVGV